MKVCNQCGETKPLYRFYKNRGSCKTCHEHVKRLGREAKAGSREAKKQQLEAAIAKELRRHKEAVRRINETYGGK